MMPIPEEGYFDIPGTGESFTNDEASTGLEDITASLRQLPGGAPLTRLEILLGVITPDRAAHTVDTESSGSADTLERISLTNTWEGFELQLRPHANSRAITVKNNVGGVGSI
jgi:hypothetical protein